MGSCDEWHLQRWLWGWEWECRTRARTGNPAAAFAWDGASRLTQINSVALAYNAQDDLVTRKEAGATTRYFYNDALRLKPVTGEKNESNGQFQRYYVWSPGGQLLYMIDPANGNAVRYYHFDRVGSTLALTDATGSVTDAYAYSPYGKLLGRTGTNPQPFTFVVTTQVVFEP